MDMIKKKNTEKIIDRYANMKITGCSRRSQLNVLKEFKDILVNNGFDCVETPINTHYKLYVLTDGEYYVRINTKELTYKITRH